MWNYLVPALTTLAGTYLTTNANTKAGQEAQQAQTDAANARIAQEQQIVQQAQQQAAPGIARLRQVVASSDELTPTQQKQLEQNRLSVTNALHHSPMASSGRGAAAIFKSADEDFTNTVMDQNRQRADTAARTLAAGQQTAWGAMNKIGEAGGNAIATRGTIGTNASLANTQLYGKAIGDIGSQIANEQRQSKYADRMSAIEKSLGIGNNG